VTADRPTVGDEEGATVTANLKNGVLSVIVPKTPAYCQEDPNRVNLSLTAPSSFLAFFTISSMGEWSSDAGVN
jgi:hypothetical protein